jgi:hypothetical protein
VQLILPTWLPIIPFAAIRGPWQEARGRHPDSPGTYLPSTYRRSAPYTVTSTAWPCLPAFLLYDVIWDLNGEISPSGLVFKETLVYNFFFSLFIYLSY